MVLKGSIAYVAQEAWVQNATLRDNVLFGKPLNSSVYNKIIDACALRTDLEDFPGQDLTEIGEKVFMMLICVPLLIKLPVHWFYDLLAVCYFTAALFVRLYRILISAE